MEKVEWHDVQALVLSGYPQLPFAAYILWRFDPTDNGLSKAWLSELIGRLTSLPSMKKLRDSKLLASAVNVALTATGLAKLGVGEEELARFSVEFCEGMAPQPTLDTPTPRRCNILGDVDQNSPQHWHWGGWNANGKIDGLLMLYAANKNSLKRLIDFEMQQMRGVDFLDPTFANQKGGTLILEGRLYPPDFKEHFGFRDGISQPIIAGTSRELRKFPINTPRSAKERRIHVVAPGEFILGYLNERGMRAGYSGVPGSGAHRSRDLARNGTYLVFRQLEQDVYAFRRTISDTAKRVRGNASLQNQAWVAARMVGRKQDGTPLIPPPIGSSVREEQRNDFLYYFEDRFGLSCPLGAHIRRANPRDLVGPDPNTALRLSKMHRIIRRGRPYGTRLSGALRNTQGQDKRGILFICLNADIAGQFELIQHSWINNGRFGGLYSETDPVMNYPGEDRALTIQRRPTSEHVDKLNQFVNVRGGAYFFLPGIHALRVLAGAKPNTGTVVRGK